MSSKYGKTAHLRATRRYACGAMLDRKLAAQQAAAAAVGSRAGVGGISGGTGAARAAAGAGTAAVTVAANAAEEAAGDSTSDIARVQVQRNQGLDLHVQQGQAVTVPACDDAVDEDREQQELRHQRGAAEAVGVPAVSPVAVPCPIAGSPLHADNDACHNQRASGSSRSNSNGGSSLLMAPEHEALIRQEVFMAALVCTGGRSAGSGHNGSGSSGGGGGVALARVLRMFDEEGDAAAQHAGRQMVKWMHAPKKTLRCTHAHMSKHT